MKANKNYYIYSEIQSEFNDLKYLQELMDDSTYYYSQVILNVFNALVKALGVNPNKIDKKPPSFFIKSYIDGLNEIKQLIRKIISNNPPPELNLIRHRVIEMFRNRESINSERWLALENDIKNYLRSQGVFISERMAVKAILLAFATNELETRYERDIQRFGNKSFKQIEEEFYDGKIPDTIKEAQLRGYSTKSTIESMKDIQDRIAIYVQKVNDQVMTAIRNKVVSAINEGKTPKQLASDLYWMRKEDDNFKNVDHDTAQMLIRDWHRVAVTELAYAHSYGKMLGYEEQAKKSIEQKELAVYYVFSGGTCDWCTPRQGTIVRHVPKDIVVDELNDDLHSMGIDDPYTNIAVWIGKNNVKLKKENWRICVPAHPWNTATFIRIFPDKEKYDIEKKRIIPKFLFEA